MAGEKVLIIEPTRRDVVTLVEGVLNPEGCVVRHALNEVDGLRMALDDVPDLIIADLAAVRKPKPDLITRMRQVGRDVPFILTGYSNEVSVFRWAFKMRVADYLNKPLELEEARGAVRRALAPSPGTQRVNQQLAERVRELSTLHELARAVTAVDDLEVLLNRIVEAAVFMTKAREGFILLLDEESKELYLRAGKGLGDKFAKGFRVRSTDSVVWRVIKSGEPVLIRGEGPEDRLKIRTDYLVQMLLHVPLKQRGKVIGVLSVHNRLDDSDFDENDARLLSTLADYAAAAIDNVQRHDQAREEVSRLSELLAAQQQEAEAGTEAEPDPELERRVKELSMLHDFGRAVTSVRDLDKVLTRVVEATVYMTRAEEGFLLLLDEDGQELYLRAGQGLGQKLATGFRVKSRDSLVWKVVQTGKPVMINSSLDSEELKIKTGYLVRSMLHVPLKVGGKVIGVLSVNNKTVPRTFTENDQRLIGVLADYAAIAIDNVRQFERAEGEITKLGQQLADQVAQPPEPAKAAEAPPLPVDRLVDELKAQGTALEEGRSVVERLTQAVADQLSVLQQLADAWRRQQAQADGLARRLAALGAGTAGGEPGAGVVTLSDLGEPLDHVGAGLILTDSQGVVTQANAAAAGILRSEGLVGRQLQGLSPSPHWAEKVTRLNEPEAGGAGMWDEITFWHRGRLIKALFLPVSGAVQGRTVILRDLLRDRGVGLTVDELKAAISQELRTPLTILSNHTDLLLGESEGELVPAQRQLLSQMHENLALMNWQLEKPVVLPGLIDDQGTAYPSADLATVVHDALSQAEGWCTEKEVTIQSELIEDLPRVAAQADCVFEMVVNLLQNAIRATRSGGTVRLRVAAGVDHYKDGQRPHVLVSVSDQGGGIPAELLGQIFQRLYSKEERPIPGLGGTGQELAQVRTLVEAFGGRVWAETEPGVGSTFSFLLPAASG
jgi:signal transduction histidine kinase/DNA-binding response OmpR family regulator/putative methionine-R-sulfoxide reductase with GAF domain